MKRSKSHLARPFSAVAAACLALCGHGFAQEATKDPFAVGDAPAQPDPFGTGAHPSGHDPFGGGPPPVRFDLDFPGGTVADMIEQINATFADAPSVILPDGTEAAPIPAMRLKRISFRDLVTLVNEVTTYSATPVMFEESVGGHWVVRADGAAPEPRALAIFPVDELLEGRTVEDLIALVERAFAVAGKAEPPQFHMHEETKVLMASLTQDEHMIVRELIAVLEKPKGESDVEREKKQNEIEEVLAKLKERYYEQSLQLATLEAKVAAGGEDDEMFRLGIESDILAAELRMLESEMSAYMELVTRMRARELGLGDEFKLPSSPNSTRSGPSTPSRHR